MMRPTACLYVLLFATNVFAMQHQDHLPLSTLAAISWVSPGEADVDIQDSAIAKYLAHESIRAIWAFGDSNPAFQVLASGRLRKFRMSQVTLAVLDISAKPIVMLELADASDTDQLINALVSEFGELNHGVRENISDTTIKFSFSSKKEIWIGRDRGLVCMAENRRQLERLQNKSDSGLGTTKPFLNTVEKSFEHANKQTAIWFYVNAARWIKRSAKENDDGNLALAIGEGLDAIQYVGGSVSFSRDESRGASIAARVLAEKPLRRGMRLAEMPNTQPVQWPVWAMQSDFAGFLNLDFAGLLENYSTIFDATVGGGEDGVFSAVLEDLKNEPSGPKIDVQSEIVLNFEEPAYFGWNSMEDDESMLVSIRLANAKSVIKALSKFYDGDEKAKRIRAGFPIWRVDPLDAVGDGATDPYYIAVHVGHFLYSTSIEPIKRLEQSHVELRAHSDAANGLNGVFCTSLKGKIGALMQRIHSQMKRGDASAPFVQAMHSLGLQLDLEKAKGLPTFESFADSFQTQFLLGVRAEPDGWSISGNAK